jgi:hypothetical protein
VFSGKNDLYENPMKDADFCRMKLPGNQMGRRLRISLTGFADRCNGAGKRGPSATMG